MWTNGRLLIKSWQTIPEQMTILGLTSEDGLTQAWFVTPTGKLYGGAAAVNHAMRYVWWAKPFSYLYLLPGIRQLQDWVYRWIADHRYQLPGSTEACALPQKESTSTNR